MRQTEATMLFIGEELGEKGTVDEWERIIGELRRVSLQLGLSTYNVLGICHTILRIIILSLYTGL
jgi:hypothetical protein